MPRYSSVLGDPDVWKPLEDQPNGYRLPEAMRTSTYEKIAYGVYVLSDFPDPSTWDLGIGQDDMSTGLILQTWEVWGGNEWLGKDAGYFREVLFHHHWVLSLDWLIEDTDTIGGTQVHGTYNGHKIAFYNVDLKTGVVDERPIGVEDPAINGEGWRDINTDIGALDSEFDMFLRPYEIEFTMDYGLATEWLTIEGIDPEEFGIYVGPFESGGSSTPITFRGDRPLTYISVKNPSPSAQPYLFMVQDRTTGLNFVTYDLKKKIYIHQAHLLGADETGVYDGELLTSIEARNPCLLWDASGKYRLVGQQGTDVIAAPMRHMLWETPEPEGVSVVATNAACPVGLSTKEGDWLFYWKKPEEADGVASGLKGIIMAKVSVDGKTWSTPRRVLPEEPTGPSIPQHTVGPYIDKSGKLAIAYMVADATAPQIAVLNLSPADFNVLEDNP